MKPVEPSEHHRWLQQFVGEWTYQGRAEGPPGQPPMTWGGREVVRSIGGLWIQGEMSGDMPGGGTMTGIMTVGYDTKAQRYRGTWVGSPTDHMWIYDGQRSGQTLTLSCEGPSFSNPEKTVPFQDVVTLVSPDERHLFSQFRGDDGTWVRFMESTFRRVR